MKKLKNGDQIRKRKISHAELHNCFFICFLLFGSRTKRRHPSFRHNSCFSLILKQDDAVLPFVLTQTAQPLYKNIINTTLSICIVRIMPPRLQFFPFLYTTIPTDFFPFLCNFLLVFMILSLDFGAAYHFFSSFNPNKITTFMPPLCQLQNDMKRGTLPSSNGWGFIPNTYGWHEVLIWKVMTMIT